MRFLEALDPDLIHILGSSTNGLKSQLMDRLRPLNVQTSQPPKESPYFHTGELSGLPITEIPRHLIRDSQPLRTLSFARFSLPSGPLADQHRFILRNFGGFVEDSFARITFDSVSVHPLVTDDSNAYQFLQYLVRSEGRVVVRPADISLFFTRGKSVLKSNSVAELELVISDSPVSLFYAWNRGVLSSNQRAIDPIPWDMARLNPTMVIEPGLLRDSQFASFLVPYLVHHYSEGSGELAVRLVANTTTQAQLAEFQTLLSAHSPKHGSLSWRAPKQLVANQLPWEYKETDQRDLRFTDIREVPAVRGRHDEPVPRPEFLRSSGPNGLWAVEVEITCPLGMNQNVQPIPPWRFGRRPWLASMIVHGSSNGIRVTQGGRAVYSASMDTAQISIRTPEEEDLLAFLVQWDTLPNAKYHNPHRNGLHWDGYSTEGTAVRNALNLFGSLFTCQRYLDDPCWSAVFGVLAGREARSFTRSIRQTIRKHLEDKEAPPRSLRSRIRSAAADMSDLYSQQYSDSVLLSYQQIIDQLKSEWQDTLGLSSFPFDPSDKQDELEELVQRRVLRKGVTLRCSKCKHNNLVFVRRLRLQNRCRRCSAILVMDNQKLRFGYQLNELLTSVYRSPGLLSVFSALFFLAHDPNRPFLFLPGSDVSEDGSKKRLTDLDITYLRGGVLGIAEVKASLFGFDERTSSTLTHVCKTMRPDELLLACDAVPSEGDRRRFEIESAKLASTLSGSGTRVLTLIRGLDGRMGLLGE